MKTTQQKMKALKSLIAEKEKELNKLESEIKNQPDKDFEVINYNGKEYRIYKWENKAFKDFVCPKGFEWADFKEFSDLINETKFEWEKYSVFYYSTNLIKNNHWELARAFLNNDGDWYSFSNRLADSNDYGRVVVRSIK